MTIITQSIAVVSSEVNTHLNWFQGLILGLVQGVTEFLPISSTAHLKVVPVVLGWGDPGVSFTAIIQLGSIAAVLWYFWADLSQLAQGSWQAYQQKNWQGHDFRVTLGILIGTVPIIICGLGIKVFIEDFDRSPLRSLPAIAIVSIVMAILLGVAERWGRRRKTFEELTMKDGILMGFAQALALVPGVSRSGSTLTAGLFQGLQRAAAARFSFLLGIPAITIAGLVELKDLLDTQISAEEWIPILMGLISATLFSYLSIAWLLRYLQTQNTLVFVIYRLAFGIAIGIYVWQF
ncbi:MAG: undecaprenyl-diphosphate phosphatase [Prochlorotrichaceae cyanobacterium]|jgi:undecaprenyl-diphosphatase